MASHRSMSIAFSFHKPTSTASVVGSSNQGKRQPNLRREKKSERSVGAAQELSGKLRQLGTEQVLQFEREGHVCVRGLFDGEEMGVLGAAVSGAADREKLNAYRHRVAVLCPGVDPFSLHSIAEAEVVIRQQVVGDFLQLFTVAWFESRAGNSWDLIEFGTVCVCGEDRGQMNSDSCRALICIRSRSM